MFARRIALCVVLGVVVLAPVSAQAPRPAMAATWDVVNKLTAQAKQMRGNGQAAQAQLLCEQFLVDNPNAGWMANSVVDAAMDCLHDLSPESPQRVELLQRVIKLHPTVPWYQAMAMHDLGNLYYWSAKDVAPDAEKLLAVTDGAFERMVDKLPHDLWLLHYTAIYRAQALRRLKRFDEALAVMDKLVRSTPQALRYRDTLDAWSEILADKGDRDTLLKVAKLAYIVCDYDTDSLKNAIDRCARALRMGVGPAPGVLFTRCQEDLTLTNPLAKVVLPDLGSAEELTKAAGKDGDPQFIVHLACGQMDAALALSKKQLGEWTAGDEKKLERVMKNIACCFKAKDLSLKRANAFLEYNRTGEGEDPLPALEAELKAAKEAPK